MTPWTIAYQVPLSMGFSRQEYWSWLPFPSPGDLPHPGIKSLSLVHCRWILYHGGIGEAPESLFMHVNISHIFSLNSCNDFLEVGSVISASDLTEAREQ